MTEACFYRYAWIAPAAFEALLPRSPRVALISSHVAALARSAALVPKIAHRSGAIVRLIGFARRPRIAELPSHQLLRSAAAWADANGEREAARLVARCIALCRTIERCTAPGSDEDGALPFLERLAATDFPVLLLWSNQPLARRLFVPSGAGVVPARFLAENAKARRKAIATVLGYAFAAFGRFAPRDAWVGAGFAIATGANAPMPIGRGDEQLVIEPDIGWFGRHWFEGCPTEVRGGDDAWAHLRWRLRHSARPDCLVALLDDLQALARALETDAWSFTAVDAFLAETERLLSPSVAAGAWAEDPHRWWLARLVRREIKLRRDVREVCDGYYESVRANWGAKAPRPAAGPRAPYPVRLALSSAPALICAAEEPVDWIIDAQAVATYPGPALPEAKAAPGAIVAHVEGDTGRYRLHDPNSRRTADIVARHFAGAVRYLECDDAVSIAPPPRLPDQRLLRRAQSEIAAAAAAPAEDAMFRFPLHGETFAAELSREMMSPRYAAAADLLPGLFDKAASVAASFGRLDATNRVWIAGAAEAISLALRCKTPAALAAFYRLELHAALGSPPWLGAIAGGRVSRLPTSSLLPFRWLIHALRGSRGPIALYAPTFHKCPPILCDEDGAPLALEIYTAAVPDAIVRSEATARTVRDPAQAGRTQPGTGAG